MMEPGINKNLDMMFEGFQAIVKQNGGAVSSYCRLGGEQGMVLTRSAFTILIKYTGLSKIVSEILEQIEVLATLNNLPTEPGTERDEVLKKEIKSVTKHDQVINNWAIASRMRKWLIQKKQSIAERVSKENDEAERDSIEAEKL